MFMLLGCVVDRLSVFRHFLTGLYPMYHSSIIILILHTVQTAGGGSDAFLMSV